jgi:hypothetical protein
VTNEVLSFDLDPAIQDASADANGTPVWARVFDSAGNFVMDVSAGVGSGEFNFGTATVAGQPVTVNSLTITEGNP